MCSFKMSHVGNQFIKHSYSVHVCTCSLYVCICMFAFMYKHNCLEFLQPAGKMVAAAKAAVPTVGDQAAALQLGNFAKATAASLAELRAATVRVSSLPIEVLYVHTHYVFFVLLSGI